MKKIFASIFLPIIVPTMLGTATLDLRIVNFLKIKQVIVTTKKVNDSHVDNLSNWILMYSDMYLKSPDKYRYAVCLFKVESNFDSVHGDNGMAFGLGQIHLDTAKKMCKYLGIDYKMKELSHRLIYDVKFNIRISLFYLGFLERYYNDIDKAVIAYNAGEGFLDRFIKEHRRVPQTWHYLKVKQCLGEEFSNDIIK